MKAGYIRLAIETMRLAAEDYRLARWESANYIGIDKTLADLELEKLDKFFKSKRADVYSFGNARYVYERLKAEPIPKEKPKRTREEKKRYDKI